jgi:ribosomal protein L25 (general stress protein Ctc)
LHHHVRLDRNYDNRSVEYSTSRHLQRQQQFGAALVGKNASPWSIRLGTARQHSQTLRTRAKTAIWLMVPAASEAVLIHDIPKLSLKATLLAKYLLHSKLKSAVLKFLLRKFQAGAITPFA